MCVFFCVCACVIMPGIIIASFIHCFSLMKSCLLLRQLISNITKRIMCIYINFSFPDIYLSSINSYFCLRFEMHLFVCHIIFFVCANKLNFLNKLKLNVHIFELLVKMNHHIFKYYEYHY